VYSVAKIERFHVDQTETRSYAACIMRVTACPLLLVLSLGQCVKAQSLYSPTAQKITLRDAHIPAQVRDEICAVAMKAFDYPDVGVVRKIVLDSSVSYLKLARDGSSAILVEADGPDALGATGNGPIWIFERVGNHAILLLDGFHSMFAVNHVFHHGMRDFQTFMKAGGSNGFNEVYEFDGIRYRPMYCYKSTLEDNGNWKDGPPQPCPDS
jgi:hypothetical protein